MLNVFMLANNICPRLLPLLEMVNSQRFCLVACVMPLGGLPHLTHFFVLCSSATLLASQITVGLCKTLSTTFVAGRYIATRVALTVTFFNTKSKVAFAVFVRKGWLSASSMIHINATSLQITCPPPTRSPLTETYRPSCARYFIGLFHGRDNAIIHLQREGCHAAGWKSATVPRSQTF